MLTPFLLLTSLLASSHTRADREALFDAIVEKTLARESLSPVKNTRLGLDVHQEMLRYREAFVEASTDEALYHAIVNVSNARKDRHLSVGITPGGLDVDTLVTMAPVKFLPDFSDPRAPFLFVSDIERDGQTALRTGDELVAVQDDESFVDTLTPFVRYSTQAKLWWELGKLVPERSHRLPRAFTGDALTLTLARPDGERYEVALPYRDPDTIDFVGTDVPRYPGFDLAYASPTYDLYRHYGDKKALLIVWHGFREHLVEDVDRLVDYAVQHDLLDHALIFDATRSRGGSKGAYAVQRLSPRPFKTTFGNLRLSDVTRAFVQEKRRQFDEKRLLDGTATETMDDGKWLMDWLEDDVIKGLEAGQAYSNDVPFKLAHLPKHSDGILHPAEVHFTGPLVVLLGPHGGSHLDQFTSIVADNDLGTLIGMPAGGYSNTWEWEETLTFPTTGQPVVDYMWSIGHTIRPNGQILEGNPAEVDEWVSLTRDNFHRYHELLLERAYRHLGMD